MCRRHGARQGRHRGILSHLPAWRPCCATNGRRLRALPRVLSSDLAQDGLSILQSVYHVAIVTSRQVTRLDFSVEIRRWQFGACPSLMICARLTRGWERPRGAKGKPHERNAPEHNIVVVGATLA